MIVTWIWNFVQSILVWLIGLLPDFPTEVDDALAGIGDQVSSIVSAIAKMSFVVPFWALGLALAIVFAGILVGAAIRVSRIALSFLTLGGGAT